MLVMFIVLLVLLVPALIVLAFAAYPRQGHRLPPGLDPYPRVERAQERLRPAAKRLRPVANRMLSAAERAAPAVDRVRTAVEHTDARLQYFVGESPSRRSPATPVSPGTPVGEAFPPVSARPTDHEPKKLPQRATPPPPMPALPVRPSVAKAPVRPKTKILAKSAAKAGTKSGRGARKTGAGSMR